MLKDLFWDAFKNSGSIEAYIFFKELDEFSNKGNEKISTEEVKTEIS